MKIQFLSKITHPHVKRTFSTLIWFTVGFLFTGVIMLGIFGRKYFKNTSGIIGTTLLLISTVLALYTAYGYFFEYGKVDGIYQKLVPLKYTWLQFSEGIVASSSDRKNISRLPLERDSGQFQRQEEHQQVAAGDKEEHTQQSRQHQHKKFGHMLRALKPACKQ